MRLNSVLITTVSAAAVLLLSTTATESTLSGTNSSASVVSISSDGTYRWIVSNGCPGYDWTAESTPNEAYVQNYTVRLPALPTISSTFTPVGIYLYKNQTVSNTAPRGAIGIAVNGVVLYGNANALNEDAYVDESYTFNDCNGHNDLNDRYHYHSEPGSGCVYTDQPAVQHSPLYALMLDGIPLFGIYGDLGVIPTDLDECNGHTDLSYPFYHYHVTPNLAYPYLINCLMGCVNYTSYTSDLDTSVSVHSCTAGSTQYDYSSLESVIAGTYTIPAAATAAPTTAAPTTAAPPTTRAPNTHAPTPAAPTTASPTTAAPTTSAPTTAAPTTASPTAAPTTASPTAAPTTASPTAAPTTASPTAAPTTASPTAAPTTASPTVAPTTASPAAPTTASPTVAPTTESPTAAPTAALTTEAPTLAPTVITTSAPTVSPTAAPTEATEASGADDSNASSLSSNVGLIAGVVGGVAVIAMGAGLFFFKGKIAELCLKPPGSPTGTNVL